MAIYMTAHFKVKPESTDKCLEVIREFVDYVRQNEAGTQLYTSMQATKDMTSFLHFFVFQDRAARDRHMDSAPIKHFIEKLHPETLAPIEFTEYGLVASNRVAGV